MKKVSYIYKSVDKVDMVDVVNSEKMLNLIEVSNINV